jgi:hypothetical protein
MVQCEHLYTHIIQLFISPRGKVVSPPYGKLNKEGVIKFASHFPIAAIIHTNIGTGSLRISWVINAFRMDTELVLWIFQYLSATRGYYNRSYDLFLFLLRFRFLHFFKILNFVFTTSMFHRAF